MIYFFSPLKHTRGLNEIQFEFILFLVFFSYICNIQMLINDDIVVHTVFKKNMADISFF